MRTRSLAVSLVALALLSSAGCATHQGPDASASIPTGPSPFRGAWRGSTYGVGAASTYYGADCTLDIKDDGTWTLIETPHRGGRPAQHSGTSTVSGDRLILSEHNGRRWMSLQQSGNRLYGFQNVERSNAESGRLMIEFTRTP